MYSDLASLYERAGRLRDRPGSVTQLIILTMPDDDITHPIPDLTGYITEGQIVPDRDLHRKGIYPPVDVLPSLSRLMNAAIGPGKTRADHRALADQLYALYAEARDLRWLVAIIGETALSEEDRQTLSFANRFENDFIGQGHANRSLSETLTLAWELLQQKRAALLRELMQVTDRALARSDALQASAAAARRALARAEAYAGTAAVRSAAMAARDELPLDVQAVNVMGVAVPMIEQKRVSRSTLGRGYAPGSTAMVVDEAAAAFETEVSDLIELAQSELRLKRLAAEIQRTSRRVNALEHIVIPRLESERDRIQIALDERERADNFRLKRMKQLRRSRIEFA